MMMKEKYFLLKAKQLSGDISPEEEIELIEISSNDEFDVVNSDLDYELDKWSSSGIGVKRVKKSVFKKIERQEKSRSRVYMIAASVVALLGLFVSQMLGIYNTVDYTGTTYANNSNELMDVYLPDSTKVVLNKNSYLELRSSFEDTREMNLKGEAMFYVTHDKNRPFIVMSSKGSVEVLGTTFVIDNSDPIKMRATLVEGSVALKSRNNRSLLKPSEQGIVTENGTIEIKRVNTKIYSSWSEGKISFHNELLKNVLDRIERVKGQKISVEDDSILMLRVSGEFKNDETVESMIYALSKITANELKLKEDISNN